MRAASVLAALLAAWALGLGGLLSGAAAPSVAPRPAIPVRLVDPARHLPPVLRFRVIANSDTAYDESIKIAVRNLVLAELDPTLTHARSRAAAEAAVRRALPSLRRGVAALLARDGVSYRATLLLATTAFPTKAYGALVLPAGRYPALVVRLGRGDGHNWWCVLFPALCFIDTDSGLAVPVGDSTRAGGAAAHPAGARGVVWWIPWRTWLQGL